MKHAIRFILVLLLMFGLASCSLPGQKPATGLIERSSIAAKVPTTIKKWLDSGKYDQSIIDILKSAAVREYPPSSTDLIEAAFADGKIDRAAKARLMIQAAFSPESLPREFIGPVYADGTDWLSNELQWLINNQDQLDSDVLEQIYPFICSPEDPDSYFHPDFQKQKSVLEKLAAASVVSAAETVWENWVIEIPGASAPVQLHYSLKGLSSQQQAKVDAKAQLVDEAIRKAWKMYQEYLGTQPGYKLDIYLATGLEDNQTGWAHYFYDNYQITHYRILLDVSLDSDILKSVTVHELFHIFQYEMGLTWFTEELTGNHDLNWLKEATAVWAEHFVYPGLNRQFGFLSEFSVNLREDRLSIQGEQEYGSYMFFYMLTEDMNKKDIVADVLQAFSELGKNTTGGFQYLKTRETLKSVLNSKAGDITDLFGRFALCNWNKKPVQFYKDVDKNNMPVRVPIDPAGDSISFLRFVSANDPRMPKGESVVFSLEQETMVVTMTKDRYEDELVLAPGGVAYKLYLIDAPASEIEQLIFDFRDEALDHPPGPTVNNMSHIKRQAIIQIDGQWQENPEDWSELDQREFCRKNPAENVTAIVLIYSFADLEAKNNSAHRFVIDARGKCADYKGTLAMTWTIPWVTDDPDWIIEQNASFSSQEAWIYNADYNVYVSKQRQVKYDFDFRQEDLKFAENGDSLGSYKSSRTERGRLDERYGPDDYLEMMWISDDRRTVEFRDLLGANADDWVEVTTYEFDSWWENSVEESYKTNGGICSFEGVWSLPFTVGSRSYEYYGSEVSDTCEITDTSISGSRTIKGLGDSVATFVFNLSGTPAQVQTEPED